MYTYVLTLTLILKESCALRFSVLKFRRQDFITDVALGSTLSDNNNKSNDNNNNNNDSDNNNTALQAATIVVAMASGKKFWRPKFWQKSPIGDQCRIKVETC